MKNLTYFAFLLVSLLFVACDPEMEDTPDIGVAPTSEDLSFTIEPGDDDFNFVIKNTSSVTGIAKWDFDNGIKETGDEVTAYFPMPGTYNIKLSLYASGGNAETTIQHVTTETDYSIFTDPKYIIISGGIDAAEGKTWVLDSLSKGHFGIGAAGGNWPEWWSADPLAKPASGAYDDEFVFKIDGFSFGFINNGDNYVKEYRKDDPNYSNPVELYGEPDCKVNYTPSSATWSIVTKEDGDYIVLASATPVFFGFDYGAVNNEFRIESLEENSIGLSCIGGDGNRWFYILMPKGYEKPTVTYSLNVGAGSGVNAFAVSLTDVVIPDGNSISGYTVDFGDGSSIMEVDDYNASVEHTYMRKGSYQVSVVVKSSAGDFNASEIVDIDDHHPDYEEFILDEMVMYYDFSEVAMAPVLGENCGVTTVDNPNAIYPNRSSKVGHYTKDSQPWANAFMKLPTGYRYDLRNKSMFKLKVYGKAGDVVLFKLENTDKAEPWKTGTELTYTIQNDNTWEAVVFDFAGNPGGFDWTGEQWTDDVATSDEFNHGFYNVLRIMLNPDIANDQAHDFYFDELAGPHVEGIKSGRL